MDLPTTNGRKMKNLLSKFYKQRLSLMHTENNDNEISANEVSV